MLKYYLDGDEVGWQSLKNMDIDELRHLAADEEAAAGQTTLISHVYYPIFLKIGAVEDLEQAIARANEQMPVNTDNHHYAARLKDLIVMLVKKYQYTNSLSDLQEAIYRAQEMMAATPLGHPDGSARISD